MKYIYISTFSKVHVTYHINGGSTILRLTVNDFIGYNEMNEILLLLIKNSMLSCVNKKAHNKEHFFFINVTFLTENKLTRANQVKLIKFLKQRHK